MSIFVNWKRSFEVGIPKIDKQHKQILNTINQMHNKFEKKEHSDISKLTDFLIHYATEHLKTEEDILSEQHHPEYISHKEMHYELKRKTIDIANKCRNGSNINYNEILTFLKNWWIKHIIGYDKEVFRSITK